MGKETNRPTAKPKARDWKEEYLQRTPGSRALYERALQSLPGGVSRNWTYMAPYPVFIKRGEGCYLYDQDGNKLVDFHNANFALPLGHNNPRVAQAIKEHIDNGLFFTSPTELEVEMTELLRKRIPSCEMVRFTCSGTETTMFAIRLARAFTGRSKVARMEGSYHGTHDQVAVGNPQMAGADHIVIDGKTLPAGVPVSAAHETVLLRYNDHEHSEKLIREHKDDLACVILEPVFAPGGFNTPKNNYLHFLRDITRRYGIVLIFDEMVCLGIAVGGAQSVFGVQPDLTTMGKVIGGGMPIGAFGGRADIMMQCDPRDPAGSKIYQGGTFAGHPLSMAAGIAHLKELTPEVYKEIWAKGDHLRQSLRDMAKRIEFPLQVTGIGQFFAMHAASHEVYNLETSLKSDNAFIRRVILSLVAKGYHMPLRGRCAMSNAMTRGVLETFVKDVEEAVEENRR